MKIKSLMTREVVTLNPLTEIAAAARLLTERGITGAPVVDAKGELLGVVSQTDLTRFQARQPPSQDWIGIAEDWDLDRQATPVIAVMTGNPVTCDEETPVKDVANLMRQKRVHRVLITSRGKLAGIVTSMDMLRAVESV